jgi:glycosyltransferase involved in cell wall biosynthesis
MTEPTVSIVIPAYNACAFINETLVSVFSLEYPRDSLELVVVDDGSTDGTAATVRQILGPCRFRWQVIEQLNAGPSRARNVGWQAAQGTWIQFLDADDLLEKSKLRIQSASAAAASPDVAVLYSPWQRYANVRGAWQPAGDVCMPQIGDTDNVYRLLETKNFLQLASQLSRRAWLEKVGGFNEDYRLIEDVDLLLRIAMAGGRFLFAAANRPLSFYQQREDSLSRESRCRFVDGCVRNALLAERYWHERQPDLTPPQRKLLAGIYGDALRFYVDADRNQYRSLLPHLLEIEPGYRPGGTALGFFSRLVGREAAESFAAQFRRLRYGSGAVRG